MKRKIIQIAGSTHLISLPKPWVVRRGIKKGDEMDLEEQGSKIIITAETNGAPTKIRISPEKFGKFHPNYLSAAYHMGYEDVEILYDDTETLEKIYERISNCIGFEIVNQGDNFCRIKTISHVSLSEFDQILRKVFLLLITMGDNIIDVLDQGKYAKLKEVRILEVTNNKLTDFCKRVLNVRGYKDYNKLTLIYSIVMYLEQVADEYRDVCDVLMTRKTKISPHVLAEFKEVNRFFKEFYESFYKFENNKIEAVFDKAKPFRERLYLRMQKAGPDERLVLHSLLNVVSQVYEMATANLALNM